MPQVHLVWLESPQIASEARPGQFVMVRCGQDSDALLRRPFSVHQTDGGKFALLFSVVGRGTAWLARRKVGDSIDLFGPVGNGFTVDPASHNLLLVAGGIGVAPLALLAQHALDKGCSVRLLLGASTSSQLYPRHLLASKAEVIMATEDGTAGEKGMVTDVLPDFVGQADQLFVCGPEPMYRVMAAQNGKLLKGKSAQISLETRMACGRGVCYGCTVKTRDGLKQVCEHGPIFGLDRVLWVEDSSSRT